MIDYFLATRKKDADSAKELHSDKLPVSDN